MIESGHRGRAASTWPWMLTFLSLLILALRLMAEWLAPGETEAWLRHWAFIPAEVMNALARPLAEWPGGELLRLVTALFIHVEWWHLAGNLAYLWVFGLTVERATGAAGLALVFLVLGTLANLFLAWQMGDATAPVLGASGGVSAVIGMYLGLFPARRMGLWLPLGLFLQFARVPALLVIGSWFTLHLLYTAFGPGDGTVGWWAHLSGFGAGLLVALLLRPFPALADRSLQDD
jgi:membrane associated rhomboid family serine protease